MTSRSAFTSFLKDKSTSIFLFSIQGFTLILFFHLLYPEKMEIIYPAILSLSLLGLYLLLEWLPYANFHRQLKNKSNTTNLTGKTNEQEMVVNYIEILQTHYQEEIHRLQNQQEEKVHFLSQWLHNLKTPISVIQLIIDKYEREKEVSVEVVKSIQQENDKLQDSIEQVLNMIRFEDFAMDYEPVKVDLQTSLKNVINRKKSQFIYNNVFPKLEIDTNSAIFVLSDKKWNEFMLDQLISNAIKYSAGQVPSRDNGDNNSKKVTFSIQQNENHTTLTIKDEGAGIPSPDLQRVFDPFFTGENGRNYRNSTGIGLYIVKQISDRLQHPIHLRSQVGRGTEVTITYLTKL